MTKILVVDDESKFLELLALRLEANGYEVVSAKNGQEGLDMVRLHKPNLIISDALMPVMDGFKFYKELKKNRATLKIPVLILTARGGMEDTFRMVGADEFLAKPVKMNELLKKVKKLLNVSIETAQSARKVLIAGPQQEIIESMDLQLKKEKCEIELVTTGAEVVPRIVSFLPHILILDVIMEDMESSDIVTIVRKMPQSDNIPIVLYGFCHLPLLPMEEGKRIVHRIAASTKVCLESGATFSLGMYKEESFIRDMSMCLRTSV